MLNFRRKQILAQNQIEKMVKAKAELECLLTEKEHQLNLIKERLHLKNINDLDKEAAFEQSSVAETRKLDQSHQINVSPASLSSSLSQDMTDNKECSNNELNNMLIYDAKDPNRPRFTLKELQKVLMEKNELTIKLDQTQDELEQLRRQLVLDFGHFFSITKKFKLLIF
jgi:hypothetical protein